MTNIRLVSALVAVVITAFPASLNAYFNGAQKGEIIAEIGFDPKVHGFGFRNFGPNPDFEEDLTEDDMIRIFGADNVCIEGTTAKDCVLYETAERWIEQMLEMMDGGHCDGFSVASLRSFIGRDFKGRKGPGGFQRGATNLFDVKKDQAVTNYISFYHTLQSLKEVYEFRVKTFSMKPSEIVELIADGMEDNKMLYTLGVGMRENGKYTRGHSIVPIAVEDMGNDIVRIHVYDNNFPGQTKYVVVNTKTETWRYHTANNPAETARDYVGDTKTKTLSLKKLSDRFRGRFECPFCDEDEGEIGTDPNAVVDDRMNVRFMNASYSLNPVISQDVETLTISSSGDVDLLIADGSGKRIGYDQAKKITVNEIPGAVENVSEGDVDDDIPPDYIIPINPSNKRPYKITVQGTASPYMTDLQIYGSGFVVGFEDIDVDKGETLNMTVSQDGRELTFTASADGETPSIYITTDSGEEKPSYEFEIGGIDLAAGKTFSVKLDPDKGLIYFKDDDGSADKYDVYISRTLPNGKVVEFDEFDMDIGKGNSYVLNFGAWDGKGKMCAKDDDDDDGDFEDEDCEEIADDERPLKKKGT